MKMSAEHLATLRVAYEAVEWVPLSVYRANKLSAMRWRWERLYRAVINGEDATRWLYREGYNDGHIDTALRHLTGLSRG